MNETNRVGYARLPLAAWATGLFLVMVALATYAGGGSTRGAALASSGIMAMGTFGLAWMLRRAQPYPLWSFLGAAAVLGAALVLGAAFVPDPARWAREARSMLWLGPWTIMILGLGGFRQSKRGACAPDSPRAGWLLIGMSVVMSALIVVVPFLKSPIR